jgi:lipopolysaccharide export system permease protein
MIMKRLDKYLLTQFLAALSASLIFMIGLFLITTYLDNLKYFTHQKVPAVMVMKYIIHSIPEIIIYMLPIASLFSTSYIFGSMNSTNEIIAVYNGKVGFARLISPLIIAGIIISVFSFFFFEFISAESSHKAFEIHKNIKKLTGKSLGYMYSNSKTFFKTDENTIYYFDFYDFENRAMAGPSVFQFDKNRNLIFLLNAKIGIFNAKENTWNFSNVNIDRFDDKTGYTKEMLPSFSMKLTESPDNFSKTPVTLMQMRLKEARNFIEAKRNSGGDYKKYLVEFQQRFSFPVAVVIMILIGSVAGIYFRKAVFVLSLFLSIIISFGYYGIIAMGLALGKSGKLDPITAAWMGNCIYLTCGMLALKFKR